MNLYVILYYGDLETTIPLIFNNKKKEKISFLISKKNFDRLKSDSIFQKILNLKNVNIVHKPSLYFFYLLIFKVDNIYLSDMVEGKKFKFIVKLLKFLKNFLCKKIFLIKHTSTPYSEFNLPYYNKDKNIFNRLLGSNKEKKNFEKLGYKNILIIGHQLQNKNYINFLKKNKFHKQNFILIYSYGVHSITFNKYRRIFYYRCLIEKIRKNFGKMKLIIIKPHPQENIYEIKNVLMRFDDHKIIISMENSALLAECADLSIGLVASGACFNSFFLNKFSINFYMNYRDHFLYNSNKSKFNKCIVEQTISTAKNCNDLDIFLKRFKLSHLSNRKIFCS